MYSMVLMAALTTGTDMPDWFGSRGGWGCCGCYGGYAWGGYGGYGWGGYARLGRLWLGGYGYGGYGGYGGWGYAYSPVYSGYAAPVIVSNTISNDPALTRSLYYDPASATPGMTPDDRRSSAGGCHPDRRWQAHEVYLRHATVRVSPSRRRQRLSLHLQGREETRRRDHHDHAESRSAGRGDTAGVPEIREERPVGQARSRPHPTCGEKGLVKNGEGSPVRGTVRATHWSPKQADMIRYQVRAAHAAQRSKRLLAGPLTALRCVRGCWRPLTPLRCVRGCWLGRLLRCAACAAAGWAAYCAALRARLLAGPLTPLRCVEGCWLAAYSAALRARLGRKLLHNHVPLLRSSMLTQPGGDSGKVSSLAGAPPQSA